MPEIAVIDLWTDSNRGDNALQVSLVRLLRDKHPGASVRGVFRFGTNELEAARPEIAATAAELDEVVGGIRRTRYAAARGLSTTSLGARLAALGSFVEALTCIACFLALRGGSRYLIGAARHHTLDVVRRADVVVWKGKNFRDYDGITAITRALTLSGAGFFAGLIRPRIDCVNASFWPIRQPVPRFVYRQAFRRCRTITVRDRSSLDHVADVLGDGVLVRWCADLSFALFAEGDPAPVSADMPTWDVALTVTAWGGDAAEARYVDGLIAAIDRLTAIGARRFVVVPQVTRTAEDSAAVVARLVEGARRRSGVELDVLPGAPSVEELRAVYARCSMLVGTRMHSCVFARSAGVPFVALAYDAGPKWEVLTAFWDPDLVLDYGADGERLVAACERVWRDGRRLIEASEGAWRACVDGATENLALLDG